MGPRAAALVAGIIDRLEDRPLGTGRPPLPTLKVVEARCGSSSAKACNGESCGPPSAGPPAPPCAVAWMNGPPRPGCVACTALSGWSAEPLGGGGRQLFGPGQARRRADRRQSHRPRQARDQIPCRRRHRRLAAGCRPLGRQCPRHGTSFGICRAWLLANKRLDRRQADAVMGLGWSDRLGGCPSE